MLFSSDCKAFQKGQMLRLTFILPTTFVIIQSDARIVHSLKNKKKYLTGVQFTTIREGDRRILRHVVEKKLTVSTVSEAP